VRRAGLVTAVGQALAGFGLAPGDKLVVGLSGGADSVALLDALVLCGVPVVAAHLDHALRADSAADAELCRQHCAARGIAFHTERRAVRDCAGNGLEAAARDARYAWLREIRCGVGARFIAVAHTRDDQAETFLLRLLRGSGRVGLGAMAPLAGDLLRPLLAVSRASVLAHLQERALRWREDPSNQDTGFLRNRVRHELIPYLETHFNPRLREALAQSAALLADEAALLAPLADGWVSQPEPGRSELSLERLRQAPPALARLALRQAIGAAGGLRGVSFRHVDTLLRLARGSAPSGRSLALPGGRAAHLDFDRLRIGTRQAPPRPFAVVLDVPGRVELPGGRAVVAAPAAQPAPATSHSAVVAAPEGPLAVRTRRPGDRVRAHGREISLKRFLMERRVPSAARAGLPLVAVGSRVLWVPGQLIEDTRGGSRLVRLELLGHTKEAS